MNISYGSIFSLFFIIFIYSIIIQFNYFNFSSIFIYSNIFIYYFFYLFNYHSIQLVNSMLCTEGNISAQQTANCQLLHATEANTII